MAWQVLHSYGQIFCSTPLGLENLIRGIVYVVIVTIFSGSV